MAQVLFVIVTVIVAVVVLLLSPDEVGAGLALVEISTAMVFAAALFPPGLDRRDFGDVLFLTSLVFLLGFGVRTLVSLAGFVPVNARGDVLADPFQFTFDQDTLSAMTLAVISWGVLACGYRLRLGDAIASRLPSPSLAGFDAGSIRIATVVFAVVGWSARSVFIVQGGVMDVSLGVESVNALLTLFAWLSVLTTVASTLALFGVFFRGADPTSVLLAIGLVAAEVAVGLVTSNRTLVFTPLVGAAAMAHLTGRFHLRLRHLVVIPALLFVIGVTDTFRYPGLAIPSTVDVHDTGARVQLTVEEVLTQGPVETVYRGAFNVAIRYHGLYSVTQILRVGQPTDLSYGTAYVMAIPAALVPRILWPDKPFPTLGVDFGREYFGIPDGVGVSIAPTWLGDLLLNVPLFLAPIGMGVIGVLLRALRRYGLRARGGATFGLLLYPMLLPVFMQSDGWIFYEVWEATKIVAVLSLAFFLMRRFAAAGGHRRPRGFASIGHVGRDARSRSE